MRFLKSFLFTLSLFLGFELSAQPDRALTQSDQQSIALITDVLGSELTPGQGVQADHCNLVLARPAAYESASCNPLIKETFKKTQNWSLYSLFHRERPYNECTQDLDFEGVNFSQAQSSLAEATRKSGLFTNMAFQCQESLSRGNNDEDYSEQTLMLEASHGLTQLRIEALAKRSLQGLNKIDSILGRSLIEKTIVCDDKISQEIEAVCKDYSSCDKRRPKVFFHAQMTIEALKATREFDKMIKDLTRQRRRLGNQNPRGRRSLTTEQKERADELDFMIEDLRSNKEDILSTVPWINGLKFKEHLKGISNELDRIDELSSEDRLKKDQLESSLTIDIGSHLTEQLIADKEELLRRYDVSKQSAHCLYTGEECREFEQNLAMAPPVDLGGIFNAEDPQELFSKRLMQAGQCLEQRRASVSTYNRVAVDVASIGAGFLMGGAGGLARLASVAGSIYVRGQRLRALGAGAVLALEAAAVGNGVRDSKNSCQNVRRNMANFEKAESNYQCSDNSQQMSLMSDYRKCLSDVLLTSVGVVAGVAPDIARSIRVGRANALRGLPEESADEILSGVNLKPEDSQHLRQSLINMNIRADEIEDFKKVFASAQEVLPNQADAESYLVFFNHLSRKNQKAILDSLPHSLKGSAGSSNIPRRAERLRLKWNSELKKINRQERIITQKAEKAYEKKGLSRATSKALARTDARAARVKAQETRLGCRASKMTAQHKAGAATFTKFSVAFGTASTATSFSLANRDRPKDTEFMKDLGYELSMAFIMSKIGARIMSNPTGGLTKRYLQSNAQSSVVGVIDAAIFANMYSLSDEEAQERIERIKNSPAKMQALKDLERYMDREGVVQKIENSIMAQFRHSLRAPETREYFLEEGAPIGDGSVTGPLHLSDLDDPEKEARIRRAIMMDFYNEQKGAYGTGSVLTDKFSFDRVYNASLGIPRAMAAGYLTYAALCRNADNPIKGLTQAFAIQAINQGFGGYYYYHFRKDFVGR